MQFVFFFFAHQSPRVENLRLLPFLRLLKTDWFWMLKILDCIYYIRKEKFYLVRIHLNFDFLLASFLSYFCSLLPSFFSFFFFILFTFPSLSISSSFFVLLFLASASFLFRSPLPRFFSFSLFYSFLFSIIFGFFFFCPFLVSFCLAVLLPAFTVCIYDSRPSPSFLPTHPPPC